jgi:hypothetical protein
LSGQGEKRVFLVLNDGLLVSKVPLRNWHLNFVIN